MTFPSINHFQLWVLFKSKFRIQRRKLSEFSTFPETKNGSLNLVLPGKHLVFSTCQNKPVLPKKPVQKLKPLPKLVYALMKDTQLKKTCKEVGLDVKGDRRALIKRHQKYTLLYNSECDQERPRSTREILRQVEREEAAEKKGIGNHSLLQYDRYYSFLNIIFFIIWNQTYYLF